MSFSLNPQMTFWLGIAIVLCYLIYKYGLEPIMNEGQPIDPPANQESGGNIDAFFESPSHGLGKV